MKLWPEFKEELETERYNKTRTYLVDLLVENNCNIYQASRESELNRTQLYKMLETFHIDVDKLASQLKIKRVNVRLRSKTV